MTRAATDATITTWRFRALDTLFFRDARPHGSVGATVLGSLFPPSARTVVGAIRFLIGSSVGVDWQAFGQASLENGYEVRGIDLLGLIGRGDDYGALQLTGPWLAVRSGTGWQRLFPAPRFLLQDSTGQARGPLQIGPAIDCDLGRVRLPILPERGLRSAERVWLDTDAYTTVLRGEVPTRGVYGTRELLAEEARLGIGRNLERHTAASGQLYQTRHVRPFDGSQPTMAAIGSGTALAIETELGGYAPLNLQLAPLVRLGGEGRLVGVDLEQGATRLPEAPTPRDSSLGLIVVLLTPIDLGKTWLPPGFEPIETTTARTWIGRIAGIDLTIHSAVMGPAIREGGWDLAARKPRPVRSLIPAGSAWYVTVKGNDGGIARGQALTPAIRAIHGNTLTNNPLGHGQLAVGLFDQQTLAIDGSLQATLLMQEKQQ